MDENKTIDRKQFETGIRKLTKNDRVIAALLKGYETKNFTKRPELGLFSTDKKEFDTIVDWAMKSGWLK
jgi:hypothetical protein